VRRELGAVAAAVEVAAVKMIESSSLLKPMQFNQVTTSTIGIIL
jgi:hypothetical protein